MSADGNLVGLLSLTKLPLVVTMVTMKDRSLAGPITELAFGGRKMALVAGGGQAE